MLCLMAARASSWLVARVRSEIHGLRTSDNNISHMFWNHRHEPMPTGILLHRELHAPARLAIGTSRAHLIFYFRLGTRVVDRSFLPTSRCQATHSPPTSRPYCQRMSRTDLQLDHASARDPNKIPAKFCLVSVEEEPFPFYECAPASLGRCGYDSDCVPAHRGTPSLPRITHTHPPFDGHTN